MSKAGEGMRKVWQEYEDGETLESKFVHDVDKIELLLQMVEYERTGKGELDLGEFAWVCERVQTEEAKEWVRDLLKERVEVWEKAGKIPDGLPFLKDVKSNGTS